MRKPARSVNMIRSILDALLKTLIGALSITVISLFIFLLFVKSRDGMIYFQMRFEQMDSWLLKKAGISITAIILLLIILPLILINCYFFGAHILDDIGVLQ